MKAAGNKKFSDFMRKYKLADKAPAIKYGSKAAEYYRLLVKLSVKIVA